MTFSASNLMLTSKRLSSICSDLFRSWNDARFTNRVRRFAVQLRYKLRPLNESFMSSAPGANDSRYMYIPFDVPSHAVKISVSYQYDRANGANTIDIGLFDARSTGSDTDPRGFRGWSGGRRSDFFVSRDQATPGYLRGAMPAGKWHIILGLYKVAPAGVDVSFKVDIETGDNKSPSLSGTARKPDLTNTGDVEAAGAENRTSLSTSEKQLVGGSRARWWKGDLHMHTVHSDGNWTIAELISSARNNGLDFIVITDHNTASHHEEIDRLSKASLTAARAARRRDHHLRRSYERLGTSRRYVD